jgi:hypothetical protein
MNNLISVRTPSTSVATNEIGMQNVVSNGGGERVKKG